ncbi:MAG: hypothetical protein IIA76_03610 [Proteobacteria bacterium]|nr:hypothetical protein [Pseudomonadota bacterium]
MAAFGRLLPVILVILAMLECLLLAKAVIDWLFVAPKEKGLQLKAFFRMVAPRRNPPAMSGITSLVSAD